MDQALLGIAVVARREAELRSELARGPEVVVRVPMLDAEVADVDALAAIGGHLVSTIRP